MAWHGMAGRGGVAWARATHRSPCLLLAQEGPVRLALLVQSSVLLLLDGGAVALGLVLDAAHSQAYHSNTRQHDPPALRCPPPGVRILG